MFFRNRKKLQVNIGDHTANLREAGFTVGSEGNRTEGNRTKVSKFGCAALIEDRGDDAPIVGKAGVVVADEIGLLVDGGFQKFFETPKGRRIPALAEQLKALHAFQEDLREALGLVSLYNQGLGTTFDQHMYDRVKGRDSQH